MYSSSIWSVVGICESRHLAHEKTPRSIFLEIMARVAGGEYVSFHTTFGLLGLILRWSNYESERDMHQLSGQMPYMK